MANQPEIRLLFVVNTLKRRGAEQQLFNFVKALPNNLQISIFRFSDGEEEFPEFLHYDKVTIYSTPQSGTYNLLRFFPLYRCLKEGKFDVVVTVGLGASLFFGRICAILNKVKICYSLLNTFENFYNLPTLPGDYFDVLNKTLNRITPLLPGNRCYRFLPNSETLSEKIKHHVRGYPVNTLCNGYVREDFTGHKSFPADAIDPFIMESLKTFPVITQIGAMDVNKNQMFTLHVLKKILPVLPEVRLLLIGEGDQHEKLADFVNSSGLKNHVIWAGQRNREQCLFLMAKSSLVVLTSGSESFPNVIVEAQALSIPVVSFDVGAASDITTHGKTGYIVRPGDMEAFGNAIISLISDPEMRKSMGAKGHERIFNLFSMDNRVSTFLSLIENDRCSVNPTKTATLPPNRQ